MRHAHDNLVLLINIMIEENKVTSITILCKLHNILLVLYFMSNSYNNPKNIKIKTGITTFNITNQSVTGELVVIDFNNL